ncbi:MAG: hypothetical protein ABI333_07525 [bacterium]
MRNPARLGWFFASALVLGCGPAAGPTRAPLGGPPRGPAAQVKQVLLQWEDGSSESRWALVGSLLLVGPGEKPIRYRGERKLSGSFDGRRIRVAGRVIGVELTGLSERDAVALLTRHAQTLETVVWGDVRQLSPAVIGALARLSTRELVLSLWPHANGSQTTSLAPLGRLRSRLYGLVLGLELAPEGLAALRSLSKLRVLHVKTSVRAQDLRQIAALDSLRVLRLEDALSGHRPPVSALRPLGRMRELQLLDLSVNELDDTALALLAPLAGLCWLDLGFNRITGSGLGRLRGMQRLVGLELSGNPLGTGALAPVARLGRLAVLRLWKTTVSDDDLAELGKLRELRALDVADTLVGDDGLVRLGALGTLKELDVSRTQVSAAGVAAFRKRCRACRVMTSSLAHRGSSPPASVRGELGLPECDEFLQMYRCYLGKIPAAASGAAQSALQSTAAAWKTMLATSRNNPAARRSLIRGCRMALDAWKKAMRSNPMARGCLRP